MCDVLPGGNIWLDIVKNFDAADFIVVMGTDHYGKRTTDIPISTFHEMQFILEEKKPIFLVKMCDKFLEPQTRMAFPSSISYSMRKDFSAEPKPEEIPKDLMEELLRKIDKLIEEKHGKASTDKTSGGYTKAQH